ncbi:MAG: asparagine synthase-related protein, partial [Gaiellales bacterium]
AEEHLRLSGRPLAALSAVYPDQPTVDESGYIKIVADAINIPLYTYERTAKPLDRLEEWCRVLDGPVPRILHSDAEEHYQHVRRLGFRTMLTGEVAEFVFAMRGFTVAHLLLHGRLPALYRYCRGQGSASRAALARQLLVAPVPRPAAALYERCNSKWGLRAPSWIDRPRIRRAAAADVVTARERWRHQQLTGFIGPGLSMEADDVLQSLFGVRTRRPWADVDLWEFFLSLPAEVKYTGARRKGLVRELLRGRVPDEILDRRDKTGFDESLMARVDYPALRRLLVNPTFRLPGVDYTLLGERLQREDFTVPDYNWAKDLAGIHAFVGLW